MKKLLLILLFVAIALVACNIYLGMNYITFNPCNLDHSEIDEQEIMVEQFHEYQMTRMIKLQNQSID